MTTHTLTDKTALVTGASRGIGRGIALRLARDGARVGVHYARNETAAKETVAAIETAGGSAFALRAELGVPGDAETLWAAFDRHADGLDILVNNAGSEGSEPGIAATTPEGFDAVFALNVKAPYFIIKHGMDRLRDGGRIINISTALTRRRANVPAMATYTMAKSALETLTQPLAKELGPRGITVNCVLPGMVDTEGLARALPHPEGRAVAAALSVLGRLGTPEDIAAAVAFLASDDGRWVTGHNLEASGGIDV